MKLKKIVLIYLTALFIFLTIDIIWLSLIAKKFYFNQIGFLMTPTPNLLAVLIFYLLFIFGLLVFVIKPSLKEKSLKKAILKGSLFGIVTYATYDLTNLATVNNWPLKMVVVDIFWGAFISGLVSGISFKLFYKK